MALEGIPYFAMPDRAREVAARVLSLETRTLRTIGLVLMIGGLAIVAVARLLWPVSQ